MAAINFIISLNHFSLKVIYTNLIQIFGNLKSLLIDNCHEFVATRFVVTKMFEQSIKKYVILARNSLFFSYKVKFKLLIYNSI
jgi:hypothetical protein